MRIIRFSHADQPTFGILEDEATRIIGVRGDPLFQQVEPSGVFATLDDVRLLAPVIPRSKIIRVDPDTLSHQQPPHCDLIPNTAVVGPDDPINAPQWAPTLDVGASLGVVVKTIVKDVEPEAVAQLLLGYTLIADFRIPDVSGAAACMWDSAAPLGPWILVDPDTGCEKEEILLRVEDQEITLTPTIDTDIAHIVSSISRIATLLPGDMISVPLTRPDQRLFVKERQRVMISHPHLGTLRSIRMPQ